MIYLGTLGRMIGIKCPASQNVEHEERYTFQTTLEGRRKAQVRPRGPRTWSLQTSDATTPEQVSALMQFAHGAWGNGPFAFVSAEAPYINLLRPSVAACDPSENPTRDILPGGPLQVEGTWHPQSYLNPDKRTMFFGIDHGSGAVPVLPGMPVTGSVFVSGVGARARLAFFDIYGVQLSTHDSVTASGGAEFVRSTITATPPGTAVSARVFAVAAIRATGPTITWSGQALPWGSGMGCAQAVVHQTSSSLTVTGQLGTYSNLAFTVTEVG